MGIRRRWDGSRGRADRSRLFWGLLCVLLSAGVTAARAQEEDPDRVFQDEFNIDQDDLFNGVYATRLDEVLRSGARFFSVPYTRDDGFGEGPNGPRAAQRAAFYPYAKDFPFLRLNGLDSQSCFECHLSIGVARPSESAIGGLPRQPGATGGAAGFASNAFINDEFPTRLVKFVRNPPHVFGSGYIQQLAVEMSIDLKAQREVARGHAQADPGVPKTIVLQSKGVTFGVYRTTFRQASGTFDEEFGGVSGVSEDLIVRPFQWKGIASDLRQFTTSALDFHFGIQTEDRVGDRDADGDGKSLEITSGNVSALVAFVGIQRPPIQQTPEDPDEAAKAELGAQLFRGEGSDAIPIGSRLCAECHEPALTLRRAVLEIRSLPRASGPNFRAMVPLPSQGEPATPSLVNPVDRAEDLPINRIFEQIRKDQDIGGMFRGEGLVPLSAERINGRLNIAEALNGVEDFEPHYDVDLTNPGEGQTEALPPYVGERLPAEEDGQVTVPLYSDLRTHDMGMGLSDVTAQPADLVGIAIPARRFLTRPLWGVADTAPYLHDGRAVSLREAIRGHAVTPTPAAPILEKPLDPSSDAYEVVQIFEESLTPEDREAIIAFLRTLRLPPLVIED